MIGVFGEGVRGDAGIVEGGRGHGPEMIEFGRCWVAWAWADTSGLLLESAFGGLGARGGVVGGDPLLFR